MTLDDASSPHGARIGRLETRLLARMSRQERRYLQAVLASLRGADPHAYATRKPPTLETDSSTGRDAETRGCDPGDDRGA